MFTLTAYTIFFSDNYPAPIIEEGITLTDMVYLAKKAGHQSAD